MTDQTPAQAPKPFILSFPFRRTGMGGVSDTILISFRSRKVIHSVLRTSRSGNHGSRSYRLYPGKYLAWDVNRSNGGNLYATVRIIRLSEDGQMATEIEWQICDRDPMITLDDLPVDIRNLLIENKDELPLFHSVFPFSFNEEE